MLPILFACVLNASPVWDAYIIPKAEAAQIAPIATSTLMAYASSTAEKYGLNVDHFMRTIACESNWDPNAIGDNGTSFGIAQFHKLSEWDISTSTAFDPEASIDLMAKTWAAGEPWHWSCWAEHFNNHPDS